MCSEHLQTQSSQQSPCVGGDNCYDTGTWTPAPIQLSGSWGGYGRVAGEIIPLRPLGAGRCGDGRVC